MDAITLKNGVSIELQQNNGEFLGLGAVHAEGVTLRSSRRPMFVEIRNPSGITLKDYTLTDHEKLDGGARLTFSMVARQAGPMEWQLHECRRRYALGDWADNEWPADDTTLTLDILPAERTIDGAQFKGFSYRYRYKSDSIPIYMILDRGTWEIGGNAIGNEFWCRSCFAPPIYTVNSAAEHYSTEWYLPSCLNPNIFQFLPLQTDMQGFTFTANDDGILLTWPTEVAHIRSLYEKQRGKTDFVHAYEHCGDLSNEFVTSPVEVLFAPEQRDWVGKANAYNAVTDLVYDSLHKQVGMRRERVTTYGQIEQWGDADLEDYRKRGLPKLLDAGVKFIALANHFQNNMNTFGVSNMCATVDYKVAETVGEDNLRRFCEDAKAGGSHVEMWGNTSISTIALKNAQRNGEKKRIDFLPIEDSIMEALKKAKSPFVRNTFGGIEADHYSPSFAVLNLRDTVVRDYWMKRWKYAHDVIGLEGIFLDSSYNLSSDKFHFAYNPNSGRGGATSDQLDLLGNMRPENEPPSAVLSQYMAHLTLMAEMQKAGYVYCCEDSGVFGVHRHGPKLRERLTTLPLWSEHIATFDILELQEAGIDPRDMFFRGMAYRLMWKIHWDMKSDNLSFHYGGVRTDDDIPDDWHIAMIKAYNEVYDVMTTRKILPRKTLNNSRFSDEGGLLYENDGKLALWPFEDMHLPLEKIMTVRDVLAGTEHEADVITAKKNRVYLAH